MALVEQDSAFKDAFQRHKAALSVYLKAEFGAIGILFSAKHRLEFIQIELYEAFDRLTINRIESVKLPTIEDFKIEVLGYPQQQRTDKLDAFIARSTAGRQALLLHSHLAFFNSIQDCVRETLDQTLTGRGVERDELLALYRRLWDSEGRHLYFNGREDCLGNAKQHEITDLQYYTKGADEWKKRSEALHNAINQACLMYEAEIVPLAKSQVKEPTWQVQSDSMLDKADRSYQEIYANLLMGESLQHENDKYLQKLLTGRCCLESQEHASFIRELAFYRLPNYRYCQSIRGRLNENKESSEQ